MKKIYLFSHISHYFALLTGLGYNLVMHFMKVKTEYGMRPNSWQGYWQGAHILVVPALIFAVGVLWRDHIYTKYRNGVKKKRKSGLILIISFFLMTVSGYLIQVLGGFEKIVWVKDFHLYTSLLWSMAYGIHQFIKVGSQKTSKV